MKINFFICIVLLVLASCSSQQRITNVNFASEYRENLPEARFSVYHLDDDSSILNYSLNSKSLLYKKNANGVYEANVKIRYLLYPTDSKSPVTDSTSAVFTLSLDSLAVYHNGELPLTIKSGADYYLTLYVYDLNRNSNFTAGISVNKTDRNSAAFYKVTDENRQPLFDHTVKPGENIYITPPAGKSGPVYLRCFFDNYPLASPPFAKGSFQTFDLHSDSAAIIFLDQPLVFSRKGLYLLQHDTLSTSGLAFLCSGPDFPALTTAEELIQSLRYLTTREEFDKLSTSSDVKKAVDDYWLAKAGNNERGRKLIKVYYGRAQEANRLFTSFLEGWKSDRGMIYIIFGPPASVFRISGTEYWRYDFSRGLPDVQFVFSNVKNPFTTNDYQLHRDPGFQNIWYMAVDSWRSGRIIGEF